METNNGTIKLNTGYNIPIIGLGTLKASDDTGYRAILHALKTGYRHIDTARVYQNEEEVGRAIKDSGVPREEIFLTTKLTNRDHRNPADALDASLNRLGTDYVDLYLMHWPIPLNSANPQLLPRTSDGKFDVDFEWNHIQTWELMQKLLDTGKVRSLGVSNYNTVLYKELLDAPTTKVVPAVNQVELHPYLPEFKLVEESKRLGIVLTAYSPLGGSGLSILSDEDIVNVAEKYNVTPAQVVISWDIQRGVTVIPKSSKPSRIDTNFQPIELSSQDIDIIQNLYKKRHHRIYRYDWGVKMYHDDDDWYNDDS